ncbi:MAG TPA: NAD-dependent epimerase/dehydratase family protein [Stellaceae bacterium]|nr:NAD-dependent epimerase/dehydratase family protein [Stellaceae bacterium]
MTGAAGFIGRALCRGLVERGHAVVGITRRRAEPIPGVGLLALGDIGPATDWSAHLRGIEAVVHLAATAHRRVDPAALSAEPAAAAALARAAAAAGARRFVLLSSLKAMGEESPQGRRFRAADMPDPASPYGALKLAVEEALAAAARESGIEPVILRPPLVYGPGVKANFRALLRLAASGLPLPFAGIDNRRSLIFLDNLVDLAALAVFHPQASGRVWLARDDTDWSTPGLFRALAGALGRPARLYRLPAAFWALARRVPAIAPLASSLAVDDAPTRDALGWAPSASAEAGLAATARAFLEESLRSPR